MRSAEVEYRLGGCYILDVPVLEEGGGAIRGGVDGWTGVIILDRVLQAVRTKYPAVLLPPAGQVLRLRVLAGRSLLVLGTRTSS